MFSCFSHIPFIIEYIGFIIERAKKPTAAPMKIIKIGSMTVAISFVASVTFSS